jgi:hypothetical protein
LNQRTSQFIEALNTYFEEDKVPVRMVNFGSLFGSASSRNSVAAENPAASTSMDCYAITCLTGGYFC